MFTTNTACVIEQRVITRQSVLTSQNWNICYRDCMCQIVSAYVSMCQQLSACVSEWRVITTHIKQQLQSQDTTPTYPNIPRRNQGVIGGALPRKRAERDALRCSAPGLADETHTRKTRPGSDKTSEILRPPRGRGLTRSWAGSRRAHPARVPATNPPRRLDIDSSASDSPPE